MFQSLPDQSNTVVSHRHLPVSTLYSTCGSSRLSGLRRASRLCVGSVFASLFVLLCGSVSTFAAKPVAAFSGSPVVGTRPLTVTFTDSSTGSITSRLWDFGDGGTTNTAATSLSHTYTTAGTNSVTLTVTGGSGSGTLTRTNYIIVTNPPPPVAAFSGTPVTGTYPLAVTFTDSSTGQITSRFWNFGDGATLNTFATSVTHTYNTAGTNTVTLTVSGDGGANGLSRSNYIVVTNPPAAPSVLMMNSLTISNGNVIMGWNPGTNLGPFQLVCRTNFNDTWHKFGSVVNGTKATNPVPQGAACFFAVTTDLSAPTAPTSPLATINSCSQVTVTWNASSDSGGGGLRGYNLYRNGSFLRQVPAGVTSSVDPGLAALTAYLYGISAVDIVGNESAQTLALSVTTPVCADLIAPSTPTGLSATAASCSQINLSWNASTDTGGSGLNGYEIYRGGTYVKTVTTTSTSDTGLAASTSYSYTVKAIDNAGNRSSASTAAGTTTPACPDTTPPSVPTGVTASAASCSQINLSWNTSTDTGGSGLSGYEIYRNGAFLKSVTANFTSDTGLPASTGYSYTVLAIDGAGNRSAQSTAAGATTPACADVTPPSVPTGFTATATSCSQVRLTWTASTDTGGSGLKGYNIYRDGNLIYQVLVPSVLINDGGLAASTSYSYRISAVDNANNESAQSAPSNAI
ncbi:MAG TPA: PKD domain-containing protein, partial [Verrucomicrobiae bacterium]